MTPRRRHEQAVLTSQEIAVIRSALAACSDMLGQAAASGAPQLRTALDEAARAAGDGRTAGHLRYDIGLAIDYLDFAPAAWKSR